MKLKAHKTELQAILPLRNLFLQETNFQIRYNACHERGWTDSYLLTSDEVAIGYGSIKGQEIANRDTIFEYYLIPPYYNMPFADLYMEVKENFRRKGLGSFILQELKKACYLTGRVPAARCSIQNKASKAALLKAGLEVCGFMLKGDIKKMNG